MEGGAPIGGEVIGHILVCAAVLDTSPGLDVCLSKFPCLDSLWSEDFSVDILECVPLEVGPFCVEGVCCLAMIEARNGFLDRRVSISSSWSSVIALVGLVGAVTAVGLIRPLSKWDR